MPHFGHIFGVIASGVPAALALLAWWTSGRDPRGRVAALVLGVVPVLLGAVFLVVELVRVQAHLDSGVAVDAETVSGWRALCFMPLGVGVVGSALLVSLAIAIRSSASDSKP